MRDAETVTFGGSGLDRAAELRGDRDALNRLMHNGRAQILVIWRGKPMLMGADRDALGMVGPEHISVVDRLEHAVFLGRKDAETGYFAIDISDWEPPEMPETLGAFVDNSEQIHPDFPADFALVELRGAMGRLSPRDAELAATARGILGWHQSHGFCARCGAKSALSMAGWQSTCPACGTHHFPRTDPVVIMLITHGNSVLIGRSHGWPEGMYSLLAGFIEPGETIEAAVRREVFEEAGVQVGAVDYLASQPWPFPSSLMMGCRGQATSKDITIDPEEIEDALWISREEMMRVFAGEHPTIKPSRKGSIAHFLMQKWLADQLD